MTTSSLTELDRIPDWAFADAANVTESAHIPIAATHVHAEISRAAHLATLGKLAASLVHDMNQPLTAVIANAESCLRWLSRDDADIERARNAAQRIVTTARNATDIVANVRAMLSMAPPRHVRVDLNEVISRTIDLMRSRLRSSGIVLAIELAAEIPGVRGDRIQLQQVLVNLLANAIESMCDQSAEQRILRVLTLQGADGWCVVRVEDSGGGFAPDWAERIFEPFFTTKPHGMGLGLAICTSIIAAHGGRLSASSRAPRGAIFQLELPPASELAAGTSA